MKLDELMNVIPYNSRVSIRDRRMNVLASNDVCSIKSAEVYKKNLRDREVYQTMVEEIPFDTHLVIITY